MRKSLVIWACAIWAVAPGLFAREPIVTARDIEEVALECGAKVSVFVLEPGMDGAGSENDSAEMQVSIDRASTLESQNCFNKRVPTIITSMIGRDPKLPPPVPLSEAVLKRLKKECGWKRSDGKISYLPPSEVSFLPNPQAKYDRVHCMVVGFKQFLDVKMGFIGNEAYRSDDN